MIKITIEDMDTGKTCTHESNIMLFACVKKHPSGVNLMQHNISIGNYIDICRLYTAMGAIINGNFREDNKELIAQIKTEDK